MFDSAAQPKVIEEAPSPYISDDTRKKMGRDAVKLAKSVNYEGAGTVEFLVDESDNGQVINFLEVNTRLQVEHPVTEEVTGFDLVEMQLRVASGEPLGVSQDEVTVTGHAIEVRVVAENPATNWMPSTGEITAFDVSDDVRTDTGIRAGAVISPNYDSLLAKVIAYAPTRHDAARLLARALRTSQVKGVDTNIDMLVATLGERDFLAAKTPTAYLAEHPDVLTPAGPVGDDRVALLLAAVFAEERRTRGDDKHHGFAPSGFRTLRIQGQRQTWTDGATDHQVEYVVDSRSTASVSIGAWPTPTDDGATRTSACLPAVFICGGLGSPGGRRHHSSSLSRRLHRRSARWKARVRSLFTQLPRFVEHELDDAGGGPVCPLPGTVIAVHVEVGQTVGEGHVLMVVEAMKMEHKITATTAATVGEVRFAVGDRVDQGDLLVALEATE